jgi:ribose transport system ATP-binding protein
MGLGVAANQCVVGTGFSIQHLSVRYSKRPVLTDVSLIADRGQMIGLLGPNGSGKSTLLKTLAGVVRPDPGAIIRIGGSDPQAALSPASSRRLGLRFVHQDLGLIPELSVLDNFFLSNVYPRSQGRVNWKKAKASVESALEFTFADASPNSIVGTLPPSTRVLVATARALYDLPPEGGFVFVDEPTAALGEEEAESLLRRLSELTSRGSVGTCFVTHRLHEVRKFAKRITVLRDGVVVLDDHTSLISERQLLDSLGSHPEGTRPRRCHQSGDRKRSATTAPATSPALEFRKVSGRQLRHVSLTLAPGEILGVTGLEGSGTAELVSVLFGETPIGQGSMRLRGEEVRLRTPTDAVRHGLGLVPRERTDGGIGDLTLGENLLLPDLEQLSRNGRLGRGKMRRQAEEMIAKFDIRPPNPKVPFWTLSGGNQQKAIVARWLRSNRALLVLHEPTAGVDVASRSRLYEELRDAARRAVAILVVSSDLDEIEQLCDKAIVLVDGRISSTLEGPSLTRDVLARSSFAENSVICESAVL